MKTEIEQCPICEKILSVAKNGKKEVREKRHGVCIEIGYSMGGWGSRNDFLPKFSDEVCSVCLETIKTHAENLNAAIKSRKGINKPLISIE